MTARRSIVVSDAHGFPELIDNALAHCGFDPACDALVFGGDFLDRGPDPDRCLEVLQAGGAAMLVGNHDVAVLLGLWIWDQAPDSDRFRPTLTEHVLDDTGETRWCLARAVDGVLVTHAGVSAVWQSEFDGDCRGDLALLADRLNEELVAACRLQLETGATDRYGDRIIGEDGPLWWRYRGAGGTPPLKGCAQVFGHTPVVMLAHSDGSLRRMDLYSIDPYVYEFDEARRPRKGRCKYAVIEGGGVRVVDVEGE